MRLNNLRFPDKEGSFDLWILDGKIAAIEPSQPYSEPPPGATGPPGPLHPTINLHGALAFPGLINSHDHLDFNLFPPLGNKKYNNYTEWGPDIHTNNRASIDPILAIPQALRTRWGIYKNLLNGFTTVVNHGEQLNIENAPITVFQDCYSLHSVAFERRWKWRLNHPTRAGRPFAIHVGEGTDMAATREIEELIRWNLFHRPVIGIHGVAMTEKQAPAFRALVWCPAANYFLLDRTASIDRLYDKVPILFGTDSTLTASWNAWDQIRMARDLHLISDTKLFATLTSNPASAWGLNDRGAFAPGKTADIVIARSKPGLTGMDAFFSLNPENLLLVLHEGNIRLFDPSLLEPLTESGLATSDFHPIAQDGKYVAGNLPGLIQEIRRHCPDLLLNLPWPIS